MRGIIYGQLLLLVVVFTVICLAKYVSNLEQLLANQSASEDNVHIAVPGVHEHNSAGQVSTSIAATIQSKGNVTPSIQLEKPWASIQESKRGVHVFRDSIQNIRLVGERHSGTSFLTRHLKRCFPDTSIEDYFIRKKHWFQPSPEEIANATKKYGEWGLEPTILHNDFDAKTWWEIANSPDPKSVFNATLVVALFRDPYNWLEAMRLKPWHWPHHTKIWQKNITTVTTMKYNKQSKRRRLLETTVNDDGEFGRLFPKKQARIYRNHRDARVGESSGGKLGGPVSVQKSFIGHTELDWKEFINRPMKLFDYKEEDRGTVCQKGYPFGKISPCTKNNSFVPPSVEHIPRPFLRFLPFEINGVVYELAGNTKAFDHPLQLRAAKIQNLLGLVQSWELGGLALLAYEDILGDRLGIVVEQLSRALKVKSRCPNTPAFQKAPYELPADLRAWITNHSDWEVEGLIGYAPV